MKLAACAAAVAALAAAAAPAAAGPAPSPSTALKAAVSAALSTPDDGFSDAYVKQVWLEVMSQRLKPLVADPARRTKLLLLVHEEATRARVPPDLVLSIIDVESRFDRWAVSSTGAQGLMQIMPFWLRQAGHPGDNLFDPRTNLRLGCTILAYYLRRAHGDIAEALQAYYGRRYGDEYSRRVLRLLSDRWYWKR